MSNLVIYTGRLAETPTLKTHGDSKVTRLVLIRNEYAGKDENGKAKERTVRVQFTAFGSTAQAIAKNTHKGDQLIVTGRIENNDYIDGDTGNKIYRHDFIVESFEFGAPGSETREKLASKG